MSLLDDARRLAKSGFTPWEDSCRLKCELCGADGAGEDGPFPHESDCPWLAMPQIVAALEAAEAVGTAYDRETVATWGTNLGSPLLAAVDTLDKMLRGANAKP